MKRAVLLLPMLLLLWGAQPSRAGDILYYNDFSLGTDQMSLALSALAGTHTTTLASDPTDFATQIATGNFDMGIFFQQNSSGGDYDAAWAALATHIGNGGYAIGADWTQNNTHMAAFGASFGGTSNLNQFTITDPALLAGVGNPVDLTNPGWGVFSGDLNAIGSGASGADFTGGLSAIVIGNGGNTYFNGFLSDTFTTGSQGVQLYINEINAAFAAVPEPTTMALLGMASVGGAGWLRLRRKNRKPRFRVRA